MRRTTRRAITAGSGLLAATLGAATLTGCSAVLGDRCQEFAPGGASALVEVSGEFGKRPHVDFPTPLIADRTQVSVVIDGNGDRVPAGAVVEAEVSQYDAATGRPVAQASTGYTDDLALLIAATPSVAGEITEALACASAGSRIVIVTTQSRSAPPAGDAAPEPVDPASDPTIVLVIDIERVFLGKADGINQLPLDGMPTVVTAVDGQPGITIAGHGVPAQAQSSTIKAGGGPEVGARDRVLLHYREWAWLTEEGRAPVQRGGTWGQRPAVALVGADAVTLEPPYTAAFGPEVGAALTGAKVGDQLLIVVPDGESATVLVVDVLGIVEAADGE